ncbi:MAG: hypothetical protein LBD70_01675, partial [Bifidobacteriaceae bacterium]|nr:hypothetical protein [Bifidobacteriaceae bacterium]
GRRRPARAGDQAFRGDPAGAGPSCAGSDVQKCPHVGAGGIVRGVLDIGFPAGWPPPGGPGR